jgi:hypothetical protein
MLGTQDIKTVSFDYRRASKTVKIHAAYLFYIHYSDYTSYACGGATKHAISPPDLAPSWRLRRTGHILNLRDKDDFFEETKSELRNPESSSVPDDIDPLGILTASRLDLSVIMPLCVSPERARKIFFASSTNKSSSSGPGYPTTPKPSLASLQSARASMKRISSSRVRTASTVMVLEFEKLIK